ncbi:Energy-coupling factor transporter ATP-binding protein EcfA1 [Methanosarcinaceae archaeon Ag5]|uniref:Energy-coupling factor transporter ATP-binding protein EcfA1 n=1 Tax=Methanolapillus africanus TaxID=3028297 RepID=A0AAE4SC96_9EURY|nr:Energy-coupling factor transporter ATP-binding protein EcfA1 [Methanosarcinaceae archaeon Ag5]
MAESELKFESESELETAPESLPASGKEIAIEAIDLSFKYPDGTVVLDRINLKIYKGDFTIIAGLNGSGKSTFALHLNGLLKPTSGKLLVDGLDTRKRRNSAAVHKKVGIVFQNPYTQFVGNSVEEDVAFGPENMGVARDEIKKRVSDALSAVHLMNLSAQDPSSLSGGEAQAAAIAGILAMETDCVVFDEITSMLDHKATERVLNIMEELKNQKKTVIYISHEPKDVLKADRIIVLDQGKVTFDGKTDEYVRSDKYPLPDLIGLMKLLKDDGYDVSELVSSPEEVAEEIKKLLESKK